MGYRKLALAVTLGLSMVACGDGGGDSGGNSCPGANDALVGTCLYGNGACVEYRGNIPPADAQADCAAEPAGAFQQGECPASSKIAGACTIPVENVGVLVSHQPGMTPQQLQQACGEVQGCYDPLSSGAGGSGGGGGGGGSGGGGGDGCPGADDPLVGSCGYDGGMCVEYRGQIDDAAAAADCAAEPAGTYDDAACPTASRVSGLCVFSNQGITMIVMDPTASAAELAQGCAEAAGCYEP